VAQDPFIDTEHSFKAYEVLKSQKSQKSHIEKDDIAEEVPIAFVYNGISHAVMLASPSDLEDFALGFSIAEGIIERKSDVYGIEVIHQPNGIELQIEIASERFQKLKDKRRNLLGRTGCGLCGAENLDQALRLPVKKIDHPLMIKERAMIKALEALHATQTLQKKTGATHACAWANEEGDIQIVREDVGRHNALDKLIGAIKRNDITDKGFVITTSRASYEMIQKTIMLGASTLVAISAPTGLAIRSALKYGLCLIGFARAPQYVIYTYPERMTTNLL
jgi:FdhD protein